MERVVVSRNHDITVPVSLVFTSPRLRILKIKVGGSVSLSISYFLERLYCECNRICFDSTGIIKSMDLKTKSVKASRVNSAFYFTLKIRINGYLKPKLECPFKLNSLQQLEVQDCTNVSLKRFLKRAPNLRTLILQSDLPPDEILDLRLHPQIRLIKIVDC